MCDPLAVKQIRAGDQLYSVDDVAEYPSTLERKTAQAHQICEQKYTESDSPEVSDPLAVKQIRAGDQLYSVDLKLTCWMCGRYPSTLERKRAWVHQIS